MQKQRRNHKMSKTKQTNVKINELEELEKDIDRIIKRVEKDCAITLSEEGVIITKLTQEELDCIMCYGDYIGFPCHKLGKYVPYNGFLNENNGEKILKELKRLNVFRYRFVYNNIRFIVLVQIEDKKEENDPVKHPSHYTYGKIEVIDFILDKELDFCLGNVIKYVARAGHKENALEDLKKAAQYLEFKINELEKARVKE